MNTLFTLLFVVSFILLVVGLFKPNKLAKLIAEPNRKKILVRLGLLTLILMILSGVTSKPRSNQIGDNLQVEEKNTPPVEEPAVKIEPFNIEVTSQIVKKVDGKYRYFFDIRNNDTKDFEGSVTIQLVTVEDRRISKETFNTNKVIAPSLGTSQYIDTNTGPVAIHGSSGYAKFTYEVKVGSEVVKTGEGTLSDKYEDLSN